MKKSIFFVLSLCVLSSVAFGMNNNKSVEERSFSSFLARTDSTQSGIEGDFAEIEVGGFTKDHFRNMVGVDILEKDPKKASEIAKLGFDVFSNNMKKNSNNTADAIAAAQAKMLVAQKEFLKSKQSFYKKKMSVESTVVNLMMLDGRLIRLQHSCLLSEIKRTIV